MILQEVRLAAWALALLIALAPFLHADGNIGCLFSSTLCIDGVEWCYDDDAFGRCIPIYEDEPEEGLLYQYDMSNEELKWFENEIQKLVARGYIWEHTYTQCVLQAMLYTLREQLHNDVNTKICEPFADSSIISDTGQNEDENSDVEPDETAFVRFTPNSLLSDSDFANEIYNPPFEALVDSDSNNIPRDSGDIPADDNTDTIHDLMYLKDGSPANIAPFEGFRERLKAEEKIKSHDKAKLTKYTDKEKKSVPTSENESEVGGYSDKERLGAHYRKTKNKIPLFTTEYLTGNRYSPLDAEVFSNAAEKYKQSFAEKNFPFEYVNSDDNEIPEPRIYDDDGMDNFNLDAGSGEIDPYLKDNVAGPEIKSRNMEYLIDYWNNVIQSKTKPYQALYAEGGPLRAEDVESGSSDGESKAKEADDDHNHNDFEHDPAYAYVLFKSRYATDWETGIEFIRKVEKILGLEKNTFTNPRVDPNEVTFKVEKNSKGIDALEVATRIDAIKEELGQKTGAQILSAGVGDMSKHPLSWSLDPPKRNTWDVVTGVTTLVLLATSVCVLVFGTLGCCLQLRRNDAARRKLQGLATAAGIDAEATRDYQELCRDRMSGKWCGQQSATCPQVTTETSQRIASLSKEPEGNSASTRSSTSSWSEEPALTNMDISTGHMVLAYMEDHLKNKDRLEQEWRALCAYEAEPCATTVALRPENAGKNRYSDLLPYDHSRVTLNTLSNHLGCDYINASTITDHDPRNPAYIAAAGPLVNTVPDFWQMVWEQGSVVMVMLTRLNENGQQLCHRYWPEDGSELYYIFEVHLVSEHIWCDDYLVRSFYLKNQFTGETRTVTQFHFLSWPENGVPSSTKALLEFRRKVNKSYRGRSCPIVVHCSDGAGRTGTYCLIDMVLNRMAKGAKEIDIAATLEHIRDQRTRTVATKQQFEFVLMAVAEEVHAILKALPAHLQQLQEKKDKEKEKEASDKEKPNN